MSKVKKWYIGVYGGEAQARPCSPAEFEIIRDRDRRYFVIEDDFERVTTERDALQQRLTEADERADSFDRLYTSSLDERDQLQQRADVLERDKVRIDWLAEQPVDTLYLDDGRIIDIAGRVDLRDAIDAAMTAPRTAEGGGDE